MTSLTCSPSICPCKLYITEQDPLPEVTALIWSGSTTCLTQLIQYMYSPVVTTAASGKLGRMILESGRTVYSK